MKYPCNEIDNIKSPTRVCDLDDSDKPREKAIRYGISSLSNAELLAIIIGSGMQGKSVLDLSREILRASQNNLARLERMSIHEMKSGFKGLGDAKAVSIAAAFELGKRYQKDLLFKDEPIRDAESIYNLLKGEVENLPNEVFYVVHLSRSNRILYVDRIFSGGTAATVVDIKMVLKKAVNILSSALIFVHNHPSGSLNPSAQDDKLTQRLKNAAEMLDIKVFDHIIVSSMGYYSYADNSRL
ncbi:MAG: DNA repair protein RadC [Muribaculaceae bacterium]|nr:DNA repair protein RadC [Muribaculaceae bacterium]